MEYKKKKNESRAQNQKPFVVLVLILILAMIVGLVLIMILTPTPYQVFQKTATAIVATNNAVHTLLAQTEIAATQQFAMTSTARP